MQSLDYDQKALTHQREDKQPDSFTNSSNSKDNSRMYLGEVSDSSGVPVPLFRVLTIAILLFIHVNKWFLLCVNMAVMMQMQNLAYLGSEDSLVSGAEAAKLHPQLQLTLLAPAEVPDIRVTVATPRELRVNAMFDDESTVIDSHVINNDTTKENNSRENNEANEENGTSLQQLMTTQNDSCRATNSSDTGVNDSANEAMLSNQIIAR